jgi:hypothetical protein
MDNWVVQRFDEIRTGLGNTPWAGTEPRAVHYLGVLSYRLSVTALDGVIERLRIRTEDASILKQLQTLKSYLPQLQRPLRPSQLYRLLAPLEGETVLIGWLACENETARAQMAQFQRELRGVEPIIDGHYLRQIFDLRPSPVYRQILDYLRAARLDGQVITLDGEHALVEHWLRDHEAKESKSG